MDNRGRHIPLRQLHQKSFVGRRVAKLTLVKVLAGISIAGVAVGVSLLVGVPKMPQSSSRVPIGVSKFGPRVGEHVPDFSLRDHTGKP